MSGEPTRVFVKLFVSDFEESAWFYETALGFTVQRKIDAGEFDEWILVAPHPGSLRLILCRWKDARALTPGNMHGPLGFLIDDVDAVHQAMLANGGRNLAAPMDMGTARIAIAADPDGHPIELLRLPSAHA